MIVENTLSILQKLADPPYCTPEVDEVVGFLKFDERLPLQGQYSEDTIFVKNPELRDLLWSAGLIKENGLHARINVWLLDGCVAYPIEWECWK